MTFRDLRSRSLLDLVPSYIAGLTLAWALKSWYSQAGADGLNWILAPVAQLAGALGGIAFEREPRAGWVCHAYGVIVGPSCAGLNFLIVAFTTSYFGFVHRLSHWGARAAWLLASLVAAYLLAIVVNAQRVIATVHLRHWDIYGEVVTQQRVHRAAGAAIYCFALLLFHQAIDRVFRLRRRAPGLPPPSPLVPVVLYLSVALGVPILNRAYRHEPAEFLEHGALVVAVSLLAAISVIIVSRIRRSGPA